MTAPRTLAIKITLVVLAVSIFSVGLVALFSGWLTAREYDRLLLDQVQDALVEQAAAFYAEQGSWENATVAFAAGMDDRRPRRPPSAHLDDDVRTPLVLLDAERCVIGPTDAEYSAGECLPERQVAGGKAVVVDGQTVGTVIQTGVMPARNPTEEAFLERTGRGLLWGAIGAAIVALLLGLALSRNLTRPLRRLTAAIHNMAAGDLEQRVDIRSRDEIGELAGAFNSMSSQLAQSNQARRQMTADIAHELRNPLMVMTGYIEALRDGVLRPTLERFDMMYEEAQHLQRLVADLRTLSLADAGELGLIKQTTDPEALLNRVAEAYAPTAGKAGVTLSVAPTVSAALPAVEVDVERMVQVLANLVTNALRHTPAGGSVTLGAHAEVNGVALTVRDSGEGIAPDVLPRVFDRFYRADNARQNGDESGLGLAIVKSIVTNHGGSVAVASELGEGSTFTIHLPAAAGT